MALDGVSFHYACVRGRTGYDLEFKPRLKTAQKDLLDYLIQYDNGLIKRISNQLITKFTQADPVR